VPIHHLIPQSDHNSSFKYLYLCFQINRSAQKNQVGVNTYLYKQIQKLQRQQQQQQQLTDEKRDKQTKFAKSMRKYNENKTVPAKMKKNYCK
jgi:hypothetical protein